MAAGEPVRPLCVLGRYALYAELAQGGMATVHIGRLLGPVGFTRTVAIKRLHPQFAKDPEFVSMFLDEARLAARVRHPNVVPVLDVVAVQGELFLVMEYVQGESLARLVRTARQAGASVPIWVAVGIMSGVLQGLHAAHDAKTERGAPLNIVHRDVSPQNILVGCDGVPRVVDFGIAKAERRYQTTREGQLKGKLSYVAPEQLLMELTDRRTDIFAASVVLWEMLAGRSLYGGDEPAATMLKILNTTPEPPSAFNKSVPRKIDAIVMKGLSREPAARYESAREMALALEAAVIPASAAQIGPWVDSMAGDPLRARADLIAEVESVSSIDMELDPQALARLREMPQARTPDGLGSGTGTDAGLVQPAAPQASRSRWILLFGGVSGLLGVLGLSTAAWLHFASAPPAESGPAASAHTALSASSPAPAAPLPSGAPSPDAAVADTHADAAPSAPVAAASAPKPLSTAPPRPGPGPAPKHTAPAGEFDNLLRK